ncbi:type IV pilus biogenesis/stability protein PilW [Simiduia sp. 21SJ11W-1]|uniref:type IV pilus biogenesis/stability protein PilW n=1 Tax=Simiduia sp. 21SJ11W-1 TaxID=2909669 RepID=UPI00209F2248|nr:type IV pilus biogenesis/stability protein PilW [Simiduia sp. 21SJ11W-1]UTA49179.1 type IV pilus biogenesis/stability protein PilW [Simiduia sp. 21SJ11W-1]
MSTVKITVLLAILGLMSGCITTMEKDAPKMKPEKALETHIRLGLGYIGENNLDSARFHLNKAAEIKPSDPGVLNGKGLLYQLEGEPGLAEKAFKEALRRDRDFTQARLNYATFLYGKERYQEAYENYEIASEDLNYDRRATALYGLGMAAKKLGRNERALAAFNHSVLLQRNFSASHLELADFYLQQKDYAKAKQHLTAYEVYSRPSARSLWLGIQIERIFGNKDKEASQALSLKSLYPYSQEYLEYKKSQGSR